MAKSSRFLGVVTLWCLKLLGVCCGTCLVLKDTSHYHTSKFADVDIALLLSLLKSWPLAMIFPVKSPRCKTPARRLSRWYLHLLVPCFFPYLLIYEQGLHGKIILKEDVEYLGKKGQLLDVRARFL